MNQRVKEKNKWIDRLINFVFYGCVLALIWLLLQITTFSSFRIPTASMHPTLIKGDYVIVNKWIAGGRIFNVFNAVKNKHISIKRIPGIRRIRKNDILIFNSPVGQYKNRIHFDVMQYYAKRCVGLPGDTVAIILPTLSALVEDSLTFSFDHNYYDLLGWTAEKFGPLYIPCKGDQIPINSLTATQYGSVMEWETKQKIDYKDSAYFIGNHRFTNYQEAQTLRSSMDEYEKTFQAQQDLEMLKQALTGGQISMIEYFVEVSVVYQSKQNYLQLENQYQKAMAKIYKNSL